MLDLFWINFALPRCISLRAQFNAAVLIVLHCATQFSAYSQTESTTDAYAFRNVKRDGANVQLISRSEVATAENGYFRIAVSPDGKRIAARRKDNAIEIFDREKSIFEGLIQQKSNWIEAIDFSVDGRRLLTGVTGDDGKTCVWDVGTRQLLIEYPFGIGNSVKAESQTAWLGVTKTQIVKIPFGDSPESDTVQNVTFEEREPLAIDARGKQVATFRRWNSETSQFFVDTLDGEKAKYLGTIKSVPRHALFNNFDAAVAAIFYGEADVLYWYRADTEYQFIRLTGHRDKVLTFAISNDGRFLVSFGNDQQLIVRELASFQTLISINVEGNFQCAAFDANDRFLVAGELADQNSLIAVWDFEDMLTHAVGSNDLSDIALMKALESTDPSIGYSAAISISRQSDNEVDSLLREIPLSPKSQIEESSFESLVIQLDSPSFEERESASTILLSQRRRFSIDLAMLQTQNELSPEVNYRINAILNTSEVSTGLNASDRRRYSRLFWAMERMPKALALKWLNEIAWRSPNQQVAQLAVDSVMRIETKPK